MKPISFISFVTKFTILSLFLLMSVQPLHAQKTSRDIAIARAKAVFVATANGDVAKLKQLTMPEFYKENYPYSDAEVRRMLLSVPLAKRMKLVDHINNQSTVETIMNSAGDVITVIFVNKVSGKSMSVQLLDEEEIGDWKIMKYWYE